jgi:hypothetical protein
MSARIGRRAACLALVFAAVLVGFPATLFAATPSPAWTIESLSLPSHFVPGDEAHDYFYEVRAVDVTGAPLSSGPVTLTDVLPSGLTVKKFELNLASATVNQTVGGNETCAVETVGETSTVKCKIPMTVAGKAVSREAMTLRVTVKTPPSLEGTLTNTVQISGAGAAPVSTVSHNEASSDPAPAGLSWFQAELTAPDGSRQRQAGSHPYQFTTSFELNTEIGPQGFPIPAGSDVKDIEVNLPPGFVGDPTASSLCPIQQFNETEAFETVNKCPAGSVVGLIDGLAENLRFSQPVYALRPPPGMPAEFGFQVEGLAFYIETFVGPGPTYPIIARLRNLSEIKRPIASRLTLWGTPADSSHDRQRGGHCLASVTGASLGTCPAGQEARPLLRLPTQCESFSATTMLFDTWDGPGSWLSGVSASPAPEGCAALSFNPTISVVPQTTVADSPSGVRVALHLPQTSSPDLLGTADLRDADVTLPKGVSVNPSSAAGLAACSPAEIGLGSTSAPQCPDASKIGTVEVKTPLLDHPVRGSVYLAAQGDNPFDSLIAIYLAAVDPQSGVVLKLAGKVTPDPETGQITTSFSENPQLPFEDLIVELFGGQRGPLRTPSLCGTYTTSTDLRPWSAPASGPDATPSGSFEVTAAAGGGPCANDEAGLPHHPAFSAGSTLPLAGAYSPIVTKFSREDGSQQLSRLNVTLPDGLVAKLAGVPYCPEGAIAAAAARSNLGEGSAEIASPSCPAASRVGTVTVEAGAGSMPLRVSGGAYLAGPYNGAPISLVVVTPAVAGPFDLGVVVVRVALRVNPETAQVTAVSDPFPTILHGIPLDVRSVAVAMDRNQFGLNPTSCDPTTFAAEALSLGGVAAPLSNRFQVGGCEGLKFAPKLSVRLKGSTKRAGSPALTATLTTGKGEANLRRASVALPHSEFLAQGHINTICTRVQFAANACPAGSVYGRARAITPLLDQPLEGLVYLRSSNHPLPDLVVALRGQLDIDLVGRIDSVNGGIRTTFGSIPDAPVTKFVLSMRGGKKSLLENSRNLCASPARATAKLDAQNGKTHDFRPKLHIKCAHKSNNHGRAGGR